MKSLCGFRYRLKLLRGSGKAGFIEGSPSFSDIVGAVVMANLMGRRPK